VETNLPVVLQNEQLQKLYDGQIREIRFVIDKAKLNQEREKMVNWLDWFNRMHQDIPRDLWKIMCYDRPYDNCYEIVINRRDGG